jgi:protein-S-isoprenylcysteine O-methyltransferase Ste14
MNYPHAILHFVFTIVIYLGLPLLGWGLGGLQGFFSDPARVGFALLTGLGAILAAYQGLVIPEGQGQKEKRVARQSIFLLVFGLLGMALLFLLPFCDRQSIAVMPESQGLRLLGLAFSILGGAIMFGSVLNLGRQYSAQVTIQEEHQLITGGLYRFIRHPRYLGLEMMVLGFALVFRAWIGVAADLILLAALVWRISDEEKMLRREFGPSWEAYSHRTWRLLPGIW